MIQYKPGDGKDTVYGFNETDTLQITGGTGTYSTLESDDDIFVYVGTGSILLRNAAGLSAVNISGRQREFREENTVITLTEDPDTYQNTVEGMTIQALGGADSITNNGANVSIDGGADDDYVNTAGNNVTVEVGDGSDSILNGGDGTDFIINSGANVSMDGGKGDDFISLSSDSENNLIIYNEGDGNDTISGFKNTDVLRIFNQKFTRSTVGNDVVVKVGNSPGSVTLLDGATLTPPYIGIWDTLASNLITLLETNNQFSNDIDDATIAALGGDDTLETRAAVTFASRREIAGLI